MHSGLPAPEIFTALALALTHGAQASIAPACAPEPKGSAGPGAGAGAGPGGLGWGGGAGGLVPAVLQTEPKQLENSETLTETSPSRLKFRRNLDGMLISF